MKSIIKLLLAFCLLVNVNFLQGQIMITSGEEITPELLVNNIVGDGVQVANIQFQGADSAKGVFNNGITTNLGIESGIILSSGRAPDLQGPNNSTGMSSWNDTPGDATLTAICGQPTFDAAVLQFDFFAESDTLYLKYVFGSEEYPEYVLNTYNDVFGFFVTGPNPIGGDYSSKNIAIVPGSDPELPVSIVNINNVIPSYPEFYVDNTGGLTIEYDGFTTGLFAKLPIVPGESYHIKMAIADAGDGILDSGVCLEEKSLFTPFYTEFISFGFDTTSNAGLFYPVVGEIVNDSIFVEVPVSTNLNDLVASFILHPGAITFMNGVLQQSGVTANGFSNPVTYQVFSHNGNEKNWVVIVDLATGQNENIANDISIYPNPAKETLYINQAKGFNLSLINVSGLTIYQKHISDTKHLVDLSQFEAGVYFVKFENVDGEFVRKIVVEK